MLFKKLGKKCSLKWCKMRKKIEIKKHFSLKSFIYIYSIISNRKNLHLTMYYQHLKLLTRSRTISTIIKTNKIKFTTKKNVFVIHKMPIKSVKFNFFRTLSNKI